MVRYRATPKCEAAIKREDVGYLCLEAVRVYQSILAARIRRETPKKLIAGMYSIYETFSPVAMYWEDNGQQDLMIDVWDSEAEKYGMPLPLKPIHNAENKKLRIERILFSPARKS